MSQHDLDIANQPFPAVRTDLNSALQALGSTMIGPAAPAAPVAGMQWIDNSAATWRQKVYDGAGWITLAEIDPANDLHYPYVGPTRLEPTGLGGVRNAVINGGFDIWQRGTSQTTDSYGSDDRWFNAHSGSTKTHSRGVFAAGQTDVPGNPRYFSRTVVGSAAGAANHVIKFQKIEDVRTFAGETVTLSFWARADAATALSVEFAQLFGSGGSPSAPVYGIGATKVALDATWRHHVKTLTIPSIAGKTPGTHDDSSLLVVFWFDAGASYDARTDGLGQQSGTVDIARVQLEPGSVATPFERRPVGTELALCQRYFAVSTGIARFRATVANALVETPVPWPQPMRAAPTATILGTGLRQNVSTVALYSPTTVGCRFLIGAAAAGDCYALNETITADAEI